MDQFNQKADRASHGALSLPAVNDGASRAILVKRCSIPDWKATLASMDCHATWGCCASVLQPFFKS